MDIGKNILVCALVLLTLQLFPILLLLPLLAITDIKLESGDGCGGDGVGIVDTAAIQA